jgi:hypothetical protein
MRVSPWVHVIALAVCEPKEFITFDTIGSNSSDVLRLSVLSEIHDQLDTEEKKKIFASALIPGYDIEGKLDAQQSRSVLQRQVRLLNLNLSREARATLIASNLSNAAAGMYQSCLENNKIGLSITLPPHALDAARSSIAIRYRPGVGGKPAPFYTENNKPLFFSNGQMASGSVPPQNLTPDEEVRIPLKEMSTNTSKF